MSKNADFTEFERYIKRLSDVYEDFDIFLKKFLLEMAQRAIAEIKIKTPVDTGALKDMWGIGNQVINLIETGSKSDSGKPSVMRDPQRTTIESINIIDNTLEVVIHNQMNYASHVEKGHRNWKDDTMVEPVYMMKHGIEKIEEQIPPRFKKAFRQYLRDKGVE